MAWIELHQSLPTHKKTKRLARALGLSVPRDIPTAVGYLCMFWLWSVDNAIDGNLDGIDAQDIADAAGWTGDPDAFESAMQSAGFIDNGRIHDWDDYIGKLIERNERKRAGNRERQRRYQERKRVEAQSTEKSGTEPSDSDVYDPEWRKVVQCYEGNLGLLPMGIAMEALIDHFKSLGADVVCKAIEITNMAQPNSPKKYLDAILRKWVENGIDTIEKADAYSIDLDRRIAASRKGKDGSGKPEQPAIKGDWY